MLENVPFPVLVLAGGVILAGLFFLAIVIRSRGGKGKSIKASSPVVPFMGTAAISERVIAATRAAEIAAEVILDKQEAAVELEKKQAAVNEVLQATKVTAVKN